MSVKAKLRCVGVLILLANIWAVGRFDLGTAPTAIITFGFAIAFELWVVRGVSDAEGNVEDHLLKVLVLAVVCAGVAFLSVGQAGDKQTRPIVDRRPVLGCPAGYVDHPYDASKCVLPAVAERHYRRAQ